MSKEKTQFRGHKIRIEKIKLKFKNSSLYTQKSESEVAQSCLTLCNPMDLQAPRSMGFSRQEYTQKDVNNHCLYERRSEKSQQKMFLKSQ